MRILVLSVCFFLDTTASDFFTVTNRGNMFGVWRWLDRLHSHLTAEHRRGSLGHHKWRLGLSECQFIGSSVQDTAWSGQSKSIRFQLRGISASQKHGRVRGVIV